MAATAHTIEIKANTADAVKKLGVLRKAVEDTVAAVKPGKRTTEFYLTALKAAVGSTVLILTTLGIGVPTWLRPEAPWIGIGAFSASCVATIAYVLSRAHLKRLTSFANLAYDVKMLEASIADLTKAKP